MGSAIIPDEREIEEMSKRVMFVSRDSFLKSDQILRFCADNELFCHITPDEPAVYGAEADGTQVWSAIPAMFQNMLDASPLCRSVARGSTAQGYSVRTMNINASPAYMLSSVDECGVVMLYDDYGDLMYILFSESFFFAVSSDAGHPAVFSPKITH